MARKQRPCAYCGKTGSPSADHVPPKVVFSKPRPSDLITVPACTLCNTQFKLDDEYFGTMLALRTGTSKSLAGARLLAKVLRGLRRSEAADFRAMVARGWLRARDLPAEYQRVEGEYAFWVDVERLCSTVERTVRGLHHHLYGTSLSAETLVRGFMYEEIPETDRREVLAPLWGRSSVELADGAFAFRTSRAEHDPRLSVWLLTFYADASFVVITGPPRTGAAA